jgi:hypothetical protein
VINKSNHLIQTPSIGTNKRESINIRKLAQQMGVSYGTTRRALKKHLHPHPSKRVPVHELKEMDKVKRVEHCPWLRDVITANGEDIIDVTPFTDDAPFHLLSYINCQNSRVCSAADPHTIKDTQFHKQKVGFRCAT